MLLLQLFLYCLIFTAMVKIAVGDNAVNGLCFYPQRSRTGPSPWASRTGRR